MLCCKELTHNTPDELPIQRVLATGYYDGPTERFTECAICRQAYSFRRLDWDASQDLRIFGFAPLDRSLGFVIQQALPNAPTTQKFHLVPPLSGQSREIIDQLMHRSASVVAMYGWPSRA